ncbi:AGAP008186-PA-like protein [Anopheles sinensis]|uniref:AGAP008186-PA-like protein n=1 Tax=Anopheles sinensis TaxID=74873 RepID=A0A084VWI5_ANOSI|nr:AGAP008186-PA-like protein [Anopheles sinensis]
MSNQSLVTNDAADMLETILGELPVVPSGEFSGEPTVGGPQGVSGAATSDGPKPDSSRRLTKLRHKLARQSNIMVELKRKIREKESMKPKADCDREELAFLRNRLQKEAELQRKLLEEVIAEQQRQGIDGTEWQAIRLCPDKVDEFSVNPWTMGSVPMHEDIRFSCDSNLSTRSSSSGDRTAGCETKLTERFEKELLNRDRVIEILQARLERLSVDVRKVRQGNEVGGMKRDPKPVASVPHFCESDMLHRLEFYRANTDRLGKNLEQMEQALQCIQKELGPLGDEPKIVPNLRHSETTEAPNKTRSSSCVYDHHPVSERVVQCPKDIESQKQYSLLLHEYTKKTTECRQLSERLAKSQAGPSDPLPEDTEREMLKKRCRELLDEQDQFRVLIREQSTQLEDYREKYLDAQQKTEEQRLQLDKLRITNKRVEAQINYEVEQIKRKFQDKLRELTPYPRLLEEEEAKCEQLKESNQTLYSELERALKQAKTLEDRLASVHAAKDAELQQALQHSQLELSQLREQLQQLASEKQQSDETALQARQELDDFRAESARIIARTNDRLEQERKTAQQRYAQLEAELARCRAEASFTIANREGALREMHNQIRVLSGSFDDAQLQIRSLRNQLSYLQNEKLVCLS